jgi:hypothetical protein
MSSMVIKTALGHLVSSIYGLFISGGSLMILKSRSGGMVDATVSKTVVLTDVSVRLRPSAPVIKVAEVNYT